MSFIRISEAAVRLSFAMERALDDLEAAEDDIEHLPKRSRAVARLLAYGRFLAKLDACRHRAARLSRAIPSPNAVPPPYRDDAFEIGRALFAFLDAANAQAAVVRDLASRALLADSPKDAPARLRAGLPTIFDPKPLA